MGDEMQELRSQVEEQRTLIERQSEVIDELRAAVAELRAADRTRPLVGGAPSDVHATLPEAPSRGPGDTPTDRRHLLSTAATVAAGAVVGGAALALGQAAPAAAATGDFTGNPAVLGTAGPTSGDAIIGVSSSGAGVYGISTTSDGVRGDTSTRSGVIGVAYTTGTAVMATLFDAAGTHLRFVNTTPQPLLPPPASTVNRQAGSIVRDVNSDRWLCVAGGSPGTWRKLAGPTTAGAFHTLATPVRVYDSRPGTSPAVGSKTQLTPNVARPCDLTQNGSGVPAGASSVLVSLVATGTTGSSGGFMAIYRNGITWPGTSNLNWSGPGQNVAVTTLTAVDPSGLCNLYANVATHVVVDVLGYYR
ncbi:MAG: hypothetical protein MUF83_12805 [Acidimicrobiales bacterium]|jgi:hypothetical protein|nr:hypothetical protein [Acidimicrobiales bacterium]